MKLAIASGKGGTGKTTIAVSLALTAIENGIPVTFYDCDVEAPNAALFLRPELQQSMAASIPVPEIDQDLCTLCGQCVEVCAYNALALVGDQVLVFNEMCHGCGSCTSNCPEQAIRERPFRIGEIESGMAGEIRFVHGRMDIGQAMATPIIHTMKKEIPDREEGLVLLDAPPGSACPVVGTVSGMDYVLMVTEPTPFGFHDLRQAVNLVRGEMDIPVGVVLNRDGIGDDQVERYCRENNIPIHLRIPFDRAIAEAYSDGKTLTAAKPELKQDFMRMFESIARQVNV
ncbi:MAG: ATP-binding protein [Anaerolineales bacterium]|nr:ATP-binding protein [Anaerolineales bacterium]